MHSARLLSALLAVGSLALAGCVGLRYQPPATEMPRASGSPVPLRVGLSVENPSPPVSTSGFASLAVAGSVINMGQLLADGLRQARVFENVRYPMPRTEEAQASTDLVINADFKRSFTSDPGKVPKAILSGFLLMLPTPFLEYNDRNEVSVTAAAQDRQGNTLKDYNINLDMVASWKLFSEGRSYKEGPVVAANSLVAQFVEAILADRPLYEKYAREKRSAPVASRARPTAAPRVSSDVDTPRYTSQPRPDDFAIVVGIENYSRLPAASHAEHDAEAVRSHLLALGLPERNIVMLEGQRAVRSQLAAYLEEWLPKNVRPDSTVFFYYSGHGAPDPKTGQAFLLPWDGDPVFLQSTAYPVKKLYSQLAALKARRAVVALDSCFSGAGGRSVLPPGTKPLVTKMEDMTPAGDVTLFTASAGDEITGSLDEQGHGMFTYYFLKALDQGKRRASDIYDYLKPKVQDEARRQNREQSPAFFGPDEFLGQTASSPAEPAPAQPEKPKTPAQGWDDQL
ncbi:MAG: caspase family protein [Elusimicrobia bacterium]|nr:caspase family protein [Elusimicrobiota bacterium]